MTIWFPLVAGCGVVYHPNPTDARAIGELVAKYSATFLLSTPTFCATYTRKCAAGAVRHPALRAGRRRETARAGRRRVPREVRPRRCWRATAAPRCRRSSRSTSPDFEWGKDTQVGTKPGTVGHPLPGVAARIVDPATFEPLPPDTEGLLLVKGANRMVGYLNQPERTAEVLARRLVHHRRYRRCSTTTASSASPTASRASARSAARWCRTSASKRRSAN